MEGHVKNIPSHLEQISSNDVVPYHNWYLVGDVLCSVRIDQRISTLISMLIARADMSDHHSVAVAIQSVLEKPFNMD